MDEISKIWAISEALRCGVGIPLSSVSPRQGVAFPRRGVAEKGLDKPQVCLSVAMLCRGEGLCHSVATIHSV